MADQTRNGQTNRPNKRHLQQRVHGQQYPLWLDFRSVQEVYGRPYTPGPCKDGEWGTDVDDVDEAGDEGGEVKGRDAVAERTEALEKRSARKQLDADGW